MQNHYRNQYKYSYSGQSNIQLLLIPPPQHCELNCIARTPLANPDCCHGLKKKQNTQKADDPFLPKSMSKSPPELRKTQRPGPPPPGERLDKTREIAP
ncbi:hypothetical protein CEXT_562921 [Caerostris extrusa]|uniref:Uncharacterized protein n=1 Tax=Caerostris extrusa TaxID=172846 RepID=A0AAV4WPP4_CAEEX|nr:hypothetical protein CEXT_562921 [Caerostris extrusa]